MANSVDERMARSLQQPRLWVSWHAIPRPMLERRYQCVAEGVLGAGNIASVRHEVRHQTPVRFSCDALYGPVGVLLIDSIHPVKPRRMASGASGRTSTAPIDAPGHRAAHSRAASTDGSSRMMNPANTNPFCLKTSRSSCSTFQWSSLCHVTQTSIPGGVFRLGLVAQTDTASSCRFVRHSRGELSPPDSEKMKTVSPSVTLAKSPGCSCSRYKKELSCLKHFSLSRS